MRLKNLCNKIISEDIEAVIISKTANLFYFSGFSGDSAILLIAKNFCKLITDGRYIEQAQTQAKNFEVIKHTDGLFKKVAEIIKNSNLKKIGFEGKVMTFDAYNFLREELPDIELKSVELDSLREIKDDSEIKLIRGACKIADKAFTEILNFIKPGITENSVAAELEYLMKKFGAEKNSFDTIVASGVRGSLPHGIATDKIICTGEFVTMDFGAIYHGYCSDMTRTICIGKATDNQKKIYNAVLSAQLHGLQIIKIGMSGKACDEAVRNKLKSFNLDEYFIHSLGHSLGIEIHEEPRLSPKSTCESLQKNMIVTDEPGIYIAGVCGVRIEDTVLITDNGAETLTESLKDLIEL